MRRNLLIGLCLAALVGLAAGDYVFNRLSGAQDAPKKAEPDEKKSDLFELLKKELDGKKEPGVLVPGTTGLPPLPPSGLIPAAAQEKAPLPPVGGAPKPGPLPLPHGKPEEPKLVPPQGPPIPAPTPIAPPKSDEVNLPPPMNGNGTVQLPSSPPIAPSPAEARPVQPPVKLPEKLVDPPIEAQYNTTGYPKPAFDPVPSVPAMPKQDSAVKPAIGAMDVAPPLPKNVLPPAHPATPISTRKAEPAKTKTSPWTLHIEIVDDMTIVTATVNKKHEFKVVCQNLDVQTGKDAFKASGKVKITGDSINGSCERLAISLTDDRLVLEGAAEIQIQKAITQVSSDEGKPAAFELKGETLNLRISELQTGKFTPTSWKQTHVDFAAVEVSSNAPVPDAGSGREWSPYGKLRRVDGSWRLEDNAGRVMLRIETTNGKLLESYDGRSISVYGPMVDRMTVRVTHIAVP